MVHHQLPAAATDLGSAWVCLVQCVGGASYVYDRWQASPFHVGVSSMKYEALDSGKEASNSRKIGR